MTDILSEIIAHKRIEIELQKQAVSLEKLQEEVAAMMQKDATAGTSVAIPVRSMKQALASSPTGIIAEFKRRSPSKGWIHETARNRCHSYSVQESAVSILTDEKFFGGSLQDIRMARPLIGIPILRKDFIIDEYQLLQARIVGADAVLLIAACLTQEECATLTARAHALGLEVLLEIHTFSELAYVNADVDMVGVNNRNLGTFVTNVKNSFHIAEKLRQIPATALDSSDIQSLPLLVSESGISHPETICRLRAAGFRGFLIGETFMKTRRPGDALKDFISPLRS